MLLKYFYDFAHSRRLLKDTAFIDKPIRWIIPVNRQGHLIADGLIETQGQDKRAKVYEAPKTFVDKGTGGIAEFLADGVTALFGLDPDPHAQLSEKRRKRRDENNAKKYNHFWGQIQDAFDHTGSHLLAPILAFHHNCASSPPFLRYGKNLDPKREKQKERWWIKRVDGTEMPLGPDQFTFQVAGLLVIEDDSVIRPYWRSLYKNQVTRKESDSEPGICIVTSQENVPIAKTHLPLIKGVPGAKRQDRKIVSFDKDAFVSYGFRQSANAPVSVEAVIAYVSAMNWMTSRDDHSLATENGMILFWAKKSPEFSGIFSSLLKSADPSAVAQFLKSPWAGIDRNLIRQDDFLSVALSGNGGRIVIRHWTDIPVERAVKNLAEWFRDLEVVHLPPRKVQEQNSERGPFSPLAIKEIAMSTVRDEKDMDPTLFVQMYRAAIEGTGVPFQTIHHVLQRLNADISRYGPEILCTPLSLRIEMAIRKDRRSLPTGASRFSLLRLILNRNRKGDEPMIEPQVFETDDEAYNCGRLLAVLAEAQERAHEFKLEGPGIAERYFGTASVSPSSVLPLLVRLNRHHLEKIKKSDQYRHHARFIEAEIQTIMAHFISRAVGQPPEFPRYLDLKKQGRFAIGFYQQKAKAEAERIAARDKKTRENSTAPEEVIP